MSQALLRYDAVARSLHWTIGALIVANLIIGIGHEPLRQFLPAMPFHKAIGMTVLALSLVRLGWRLTHPAPPLPANMVGWEKVAAHAIHWIFYGLMIALPMTGWIFSSASKYPISWFGLFEIPKLAVEKGSALAEITNEVHELLGYAWIALLLIHVGAALRHHFVLKDGLMARMWG
jgi:cytochrome b561